MKKTIHHQIISIADSWYDTWQIFIHHFFKLILITAIPIAVTYILAISAVTSFFATLQENISNPAQLINQASNYLYFAIIAAIIVILFEIWGGVAIIVTTIYHKETLKTIVKKSLEAFWSFVLLGLLLLSISLLSMVAGYIFITILAIILGMISNVLLEYLFIYLNLFPFLLSIVVIYFFTFSPYFLIEDNQSAVAAVRKSYHLIRGYFFPILIRLLIAYAVVTTISFLLNLIPQVGQYISSLISIPFLALYIFVLYKNIKPKTN